MNETRGFLTEAEVIECKDICRSAKRAAKWACAGVAVGLSSAVAVEVVPVLATAIEASPWPLKFVPHLMTAAFAVDGARSLFVYVEKADMLRYDAAEKDLHRRKNRTPKQGKVLTAG